MAGDFDRICHTALISSFQKLKGKPMKLYFFTNMITILLFIIRFDAVQIDPAAGNVAYSKAGGYAEHHLEFKNWLKLSDDQKEAVLTEYLDFIRTPGHKPLSIEDFQSFRDILLDTQLDDLLDYVNQCCARFENAPRVDGSVVDAIIFQYVKNRVEAEKNFQDLLSVAKNLSKTKDMGNKEVPAQGDYAMFEYSERYGNVFDTPRYRFSCEWWQKQDQDEKRILVTGYVAFLHIRIRKDWCSDHEEIRRYDLFCKLVSVDDLVNHVDSMFKDPLNRYQGAQSLIYKYLIYNFQNYIDAPIMLSG
jgi:hypothetical protein